jgi:protein-disulfide isomerase
MTGWLALVLLAAGTAAIAQDGLVEGRADSPVRIVIYEDLQCPDCARFRVMLDQRLLPRYAEKVAFVHRDFPLAKHVWARRAAIASRYFAARDPQLALDYRRHTLASLLDTTEANFNGKLADFATQHGVDPAGAVASLADAKLAALVDKGCQDGIARGVAHTPTAFVNGRPFIETFTFEEISKGIDQALAETK